MGVGDWLREKASNIPGYTKPLTDAAKALTPAPAPAVAAPVTAPDIVPTAARGTPAANRQIWNKGTEGTVEAAPAPVPSPQGLVVSPNVGIEKIRQGQD